MKQLFVFGFIFMLMSCQNEELFEQLNEDTSLSTESELSKLILRLTQNPTAYDDFIDNSSSFSLEFPFEIKVNSDDTFSITEFSDYQPLIEELSSMSDDYSIEIDYPITVSLPNYETLSLQNQDEADALTAQLEGNSEINCLNYVYPIDVNVFDRENSFTSRRTLQNDAQFYNFIESLRENDGFYELRYPITVAIEEEPQSLSSNVELNSVIENLDEYCFTPNLFDQISRKEQLIEFITDGEFRITNFIDDDNQNQTSAYEEFRFAFNEDESIFIKNVLTGETFAGEWEVDAKDKRLILEIDFDGSDLLDELDADWIVSNFGNQNRLMLRDSGDSNTSILTFQKI